MNIIKSLHQLFSASVIALSLSAILSSTAFSATILSSTILSATTSATQADTKDNKISMTSSEFKTPVLELYTSEGCSSCPSADDWLRKLGRSLDQKFHAVPLAFHVDYWNYIGWIDPYSKPKFTKRQRELVAKNGQNTSYTPEFFVDGREQRGGTRIIRAIRDANAEKAEATIKVEVIHQADRIAARIDVDNRAELSATQSYVAHVAVYESEISGKIDAGENEGKTLHHDFTVRHWSKPIAIRAGTNIARVDVELPASWKRTNLGLAVVVFERNSGKTLQAVRAPLKPLFVDEVAVN